jgi:hypothetical protein
MSEKLQVWHLKMDCIVCVHPIDFEFKEQNRYGSKVSFFLPLEIMVEAWKPFNHLEP